MRVLLLVLIILATSAPSVASPIERWSVTAGGFWIPGSLLVVARGEAQRGHFALTAGLDHDRLDEDRAAGATDDYRLWSGTLGVRAYTGHGRGGFAELSFAYARLGLYSRDAAGEETDDTAGLPIAAITLGGRLAQHPTGWFGELGLRIIVFLAERHLYTTPAPPPGSEDLDVSERSWFFAGGGRSAQLYVAGGYRF